MRSPKLTSALALALMALAVPATASARAHHHGAGKHSATPGHCRLTLNVAPRLVTSGETALAYGQASCPAGAEAGQTVTVYEHAATTGGYSVAGTATTDPHGFYQLTTPALTQNSVFYATLASRAQPAPHGPRDRAGGARRARRKASSSSPGSAPAAATRSRSTARSAPSTRAPR